MGTGSSASRTEGAGLPSRVGSRVPGARQNGVSREPRARDARDPEVGGWARRSGLRGAGSRGGARRIGGGAEAEQGRPLHIPSPPRLASGGGGGSSGGGGGGGSWSRRVSSPRGGTRVCIGVRLGPRTGGFGVHSGRRGGSWARWNLHARDAGLLRGGPGGARGTRAGLRAGAMQRDPDLAGDAVRTPSSSETPCSGSGPTRGDSILACLELWAGALAVFVLLAGLSMRRTCGVPRHWLTEPPRCAMPSWGVRGLSVGAQQGMVRAI